MLSEAEVLCFLDPNQPHSSRGSALQALIVQLEAGNTLPDRCMEALRASPLDALLMGCVDRELQLGIIRVFLLANIDPCFKQPEFVASFRCINLSKFMPTSKPFLREIDRACSPQPIIDFDVPAVTISHESRVQVIHDAWINLSMSNIGVYGSVSNGELFVDISYSSVADWLIKESMNLEFILKSESGQEVRASMKTATVPPATLGQIVSRLSCIKKRKLSQAEHLIRLPAVSSVKRHTTVAQSGDILCKVIERMMRSKSRGIEKKLERTKHSIVERIKAFGKAKVRRHCVTMGTTICSALDQVFDSTKYLSFPSKEIFQ